MKRSAGVLAVLAAMAVPSTVVSAHGRDRQHHAPDPYPGECVDDADIDVPDGFCATVFATGVPNVRQLVVTPDGRVYAAIQDAPDGSATGGVAAFADDDGDGHADRVERFSDAGGNGVDISRGWLYFAQHDRILRYGLSDVQLTPPQPPETLVEGLPATGDHVNKTVAVRGPKMFVNIGSASNSCQVENRVPFSPGIDPCPELDVRAGVWRFSATRTGQNQSDGFRWAAGARNMVALDTEPRTGALYGVQNGRDQLFENWPDRYTEEDDLVLPAEELFKLRPGRSYGWPYCYFDPTLGHKVLAPEYGGDGEQVGRCDDATDPLVTFPAHWAPLSMTFTPPTATQHLPPALHRGAFVAFHGSRFDPAAQPEGPGYNVVFVPFERARPTGDWMVFADGFAQTTEGLPDAAAHRPVGVTVAPDGAIYVSDDKGGYIYRIVWTG